MTVVSGLIAFAGVIGTIAVILSLSALAETWLPADDPPPGVAPYERPLVRVLQPGAHRPNASAKVGPQPGLLTPTAAKPFKH